MEHSALTSMVLSRQAKIFVKQLLPETAEAAFFNHLSSVGRFRPDMGGGTDSFPADALTKHEILFVPEVTGRGQICPRPEARCRAIRGQNRNQGTNEGTKWEPPKPASMGFGDKSLVLSPFSHIIKGVREKIRVAYICRNGDKKACFVPEAHGCLLFRASPFVPPGTASGIPLPSRTP